MKFDKEVWKKALLNKEAAKEKKYEMVNIDLTDVEVETATSVLLQQELHAKMVEHKKQLEQTMFYGSAGTEANPNYWWNSTNDPKTWGGHTHAPALSLSATSSANYNYTQIFAAPQIVDAIKNYKPKMTREAAIALNNGEVSVPF